MCEAWWSQVGSHQASPFRKGVLLCGPEDPSAQFPLALPWFDAGSPGVVPFNHLTEDQLTAYRQEYRAQLDLEVADFDPQIIHAQHVWLEGQLALETGVPYVLTAWEPELEPWAADPRFRNLAEQAAENASRILVASEALGRRVADHFEGTAERLIVVPQLATDPAAAAPVLAGIYREAFQERFGKTP